MRGLLVLAGLLAACGSPDPEAPPEIAYGLEECSHCRMIISEERFAAATRTAGGAVARYDDVGCLLPSWRPGERGRISKLNRPSVSTCLPSMRNMTFLTTNSV